jgi:hypothetical protein
MIDFSVLPNNAQKEYFDFFYEITILSFPNTRKIADLG